MSLMGLDVGTTACKAVAFDEQGQILATAYREYPLHNPDVGLYELEPQLVWGYLRDCIREVNACLSHTPVKVVGISSQGEALIPIGRDGRVLANSPVSSDRRGLDQARWLGDILGEGYLRQITGQPLHPMYSVVKLLWWRQHRVDIFKRAWKFLCYGDYVAWKLGMDPAIDYTMAARTMLFDVRSLNWSQEILSAIDLDADRLARVVPSGTVLGEMSAKIASKLSFQPGVKVVAGGHDQPCGALGAGVLHAGQVMYAIGTTEAVACVLPQPIQGNKAERYPCYPHVVSGMYITLIGSQTGGRLLRWYRDELGSAESTLAREAKMNVYEVITSQVSDKPSRLLVLPHFAGSSSYYNDPESKGAILGLTFDTTRADLVKAILEGITYEQALSIQQLRQAGVEITLVRAIGGGSRSDLWLQMKADILSSPIEALFVSEAASMGAAMLGGWGIGIYHSLPEAVAQTISVRKIFLPDKEKSDFYEQRLRVYERIYPALQKLNLEI